MMQANFVSAIITNHKNDVLMIYVQGDTDPHPYWSLPGGRVEKGETASSALLREVKEETGLDLLSTGEIAYQTKMQFDDRTTYAIVYHIGANKWSGTVSPDDPEGEILKADWIPVKQAIQYLKKIDYLPMSEPPIAYLSKTADAGKVWHYRLNGNGAKWVSNDE